MLRNLDLGIGQFFAAWGFMAKHKLFKYALYPILICFFIYFFLIAGLKSSVEKVSALIHNWFGVEQDGAIDDMGIWDKIWHYIKVGSDYVIEGVLWVVFIIIGLRVIKYVTLILMAPFMAKLAERMDEILTGTKLESTRQQFINDVVRGIKLALRNFVVEMLFIIVFSGGQLLLSLILPPLALLITPFSTVVLFLVGSYFFGFSTMDYTNERRGRSVKESVAYTRNHKGLAIGNGIMFNLASKIPFVGAAIGVVGCTAGATLAIYKAEIREGKRVEAPKQ